MTATAAFARPGPSAGSAGPGAGRRWPSSRRRARLSASPRFRPSVGGRPWPWCKPDGRAPLGRPRPTCSARPGPRAGPGLAAARLYQDWPAVAWLSEAAYAWVARHRKFLSSGALPAGQPGPAGHLLSAAAGSSCAGWPWSFGLAFWSLDRQLDGLIGSHGVLPAADFLGPAAPTLWRLPLDPAAQPGLVQPQRRGPALALPRRPGPFRGQPGWASAPSPPTWATCGPAIFPWWGWARTSCSFNGTACCWRPGCWPCWPRPGPCGTRPRPAPGARAAAAVALPLAALPADAAFGPP